MITSLVNIRKWFSIHSTIGVLLINDQFFCYTIEDVARAPGVKIPKETAIPEGDYFIKITESERFKRLMPLIYNTNALTVIDKRGNTWSGIRQHIANTDKDVEGCQGLGNIKKTDFIGASTEAFDAYYDLLFATIGTDKTIPYKIINKQE